MKSALLKGATALIGVALLSACAGTREHRGHVIDKELASGIQVGVDNKESVERTLGRPTFTGQFNPNDWYYVARDTATLAFRLPRVTDQTVLKVSFDQSGNVASVGQTGKELVAAINPSDDKTPTLGRRKSFFEELFGNIGTITQPGLGGGQPQQ